jgi:RNA polymerase sigma-70 factor (ECF subfamily)
VADSGGVDEQALVRSAQTGTEEAFAAIYRLHKRKVASVCRRYLRDPGDVEDAVQETFLKAFVALPRFNGQFRLGAWLARIAVNTAIDRSRMIQRKPSTPFALEDMPDLQSVATEEVVVGDVTPAADLLDRLSPYHARALTLRAVQGASHIEIADDLGISPSQAKSLLHRARTAFKQAWSKVASGAAFLLVAGGLMIMTRFVRSSAARVATASQMITGEGAAAPIAFLGDGF